MTFETIEFKAIEQTALITLNRPDKLNALNRQLLVDLKSCLEAVQADSSFRSVVITGSGEKAFAAGADISELHNCDAESGKDFALFGQSVFDLIESFKLPVIAAVNGFALGGGCELALACHFRFCSTRAKFGQPEVNLGVIPGYGGTQRLTRLCGSAIATELILSAVIIDAERALQIGLVNSVFSPEDLLESTMKVSALINSKAPIAVQRSLECIREVASLSPADGMLYEANSFGAVCGTKDFKEGTLAFLEKRAANFIGG